MLTLLFSISMARIASFEKRRWWLWGPGTFAAAGSIQTFLIQGYWGAVLGFILSFASMTYAKMKYPVNLGPTVNNNSSPVDDE
jgi:hypothetical protein